MKTPAIILLAAAILNAAEPVDPLVSYSGPSVRGVDTATLTGKVMAGYQGWFNCEGDGAALGWKHWARERSKPFGPGNVTVDLWPDVTELSPAERHTTGFNLADGKPAEVFSSFDRQTVLRHFRWMREYGIDGVFVQRFANGLRSAAELRHKNVVLANCREGANREGRTYAVMYDLSGLKAGDVARVAEDWKTLRSRMRVGEDPAYLRHRGKPLVAVWGVGFSDKRAYTLTECRSLIETLKADGCAVMLGVPSWWRELQTRRPARPRAPRVAQTRRRGQPVDARTLPHSRRGRPPWRHGVETRPRLVSRTVAGLHAGGLPRFQLA